jgi:hypothetical protein
MRRRQRELLHRVVDVGLDAGTDYPCPVQVEHADKGVMWVTVYELDDEDEYLTGETSRHKTSLRRVLRDAVAYQVTHIDVKGLDPDEALELLLFPDYVEFLHDLADQGPVWINGRACTVVDGLVTPA